jgi:F0F1-type ATP synthase membrane subunit b/b'
MLAEAAEKRKQAIEAARAQAEQEGSKEVENLKQKSKEQTEQTRQKAKGMIDSCAEKVLMRLRETE